MDDRLKDTIAVRFSKYSMSKIDTLIEMGEFKNRSDFVRTATSELISKVEVLTPTNSELNQREIGNV